MAQPETPFRKPLSRRSVLKQTARFTAGLSALALTRTSPFRLVREALAETHPAIGTYPAGSSGDSVYIGITVPRTGSYAVQGEDELKGYELAIEHINSGHELIKIYPKTKGVLGKQLNTASRISNAKPNIAVQAQQRFMSETRPF